MSKKEIKINIIGAGVSGLIAAKTLESKGYFPVIFEKSDRVGGRVKTDMVNGVPLDRGFQVLLEAYPAAKKHLDYKGLNLQAFLPGSVIFKNGKPSQFGDPLRKASFLLPTVLSQHAGSLDKLRIFQLHRQLRKESINDIFSKEEQSTLDYLKAKGFSKRVIERFFQPFFSGIFLETELSTSSRMFEFVFKMFAEGNALVPKAGIEEIPKQLKAQLKQSTFHFNVDVVEVSNEGLTLEGFPMVESDFTIIATEADQLVANLRNQKTNWKSCVCLYFEVKNKVIHEALIGLIPGKQLINNLHYVDAISEIQQPDYSVISVTVVNDQGLDPKKLVEKVTEELNRLSKIEVHQHLASYYIPKALPNLTSLEYDVPASQTQLLDKVFLAGDLTLNGSLNAAMIAGERAAEAVLSKLERS